MPQQSRKVLLENRANRANKFEQRRKELAASALEALAENGYANTSLRDIASKSGFSLGTLHYYFEDKVDLISYCTRVYKLDFIDAFNSLIDAANSLDELIDEFVKFTVQSVADNGETHRLWYDMKSQALFEPEFNDSVSEVDKLLEGIIDNLVAKAREFSGSEISMTVQQCYWVLDGFFQHYLRLHLLGEPSALKEYSQELHKFLSSVLRQ